MGGDGVPAAARVVLPVGTRRPASHALPRPWLRLLFLPFPSTQSIIQALPDMHYDLVINVDLYVLLALERSLEWMEGMVWMAMDRQGGGGGMDRGKATGQLPTAATYNDHPHCYTASPADHSCATDKKNKNKKEKKESTCVTARLTCPVPPHAPPTLLIPSCRFGTNKKVYEGKFHITNYYEGEGGWREGEIGW